MNGEFRTIQKTIWIDMDNSPHVPFFAPITEKLQAAGFDVLLTARDCFQVKELTELLDLKSRIIGCHYGKNKLAKLTGLCIRALQLLPTVRRARPTLAVSHGSRSQLIVSKLLGIPVIMIMDYEYAKLSAGIHPDWIITPDLVSSASAQHPPERVLTYPGIKEDVYSQSFQPQPGLRNALGVDENEVMVTVRPPATEAHYHVPESDELFSEVMTYLGDTPGLRVVLLPRNARQEVAIRHAYAHLFDCGKVIVPVHAVNGLNLVWQSDLIISGGGTMNREAAALGVPVYSIFRGRIGAIDRALADAGRLTLIESKDEVRHKLNLVRRRCSAGPPSGNRSALEVITEHIASIATQS